MKSARDNQRQRILELLTDARGAWVPLPEIARCAAQYNARIFELRRQGFTITNRTADVGGERHSWFRLDGTSALTKVQPRPVPETLPLFAEGGR